MLARTLLGALALVASLLAGCREAPPPAAQPAPPALERRPAAKAAPAPRDKPRWPRPAWRDSRAVGEPHAGRLVRGVRLPRAGRDHFTWDPITKTSPSRPWRRWATDDTIRTVLRVLARFRRAHPDAARVGVGDLSRPHGGDFGPQYGIVGHATHQNGLDVDVYYPRRSGSEAPPRSVAQIDRRLAQELVDRFTRAGAETIYVGPGTRLTGAAGVVRTVGGHDDHLHVRLP